MKGEYPPVISWLMEVYAASKHFTNLVKKEEIGAVEMVMNMMKGGLYSKDKDVAMWTLKVFGKFAYDFAGVELSKNVWSWFVAADGGMDGVVYCMKKHEEAQKVAMETMLSFGQQNMKELFTTNLKTIVKAGVSYWRWVTSSMKIFSTIQSCNDDKQNKEFCGLLDHWLDSAVKITENEGRYSVEERASTLSVLTEIWRYFPNCVEQRESVANRILGTFKRGAKDKSLALQHYSLALQFNLLEDFATERRTYAPTIYKTIAFNALETHPNETLREFILCNLGLLYKKMPVIPISIVVEPLGKQIQVSENVTFFYNLFDFGLFGNLSEHPKLHTKNALQLLDLLAKVILKESLFSGIALKLFTKIISTKKEEAQAIEFLKKFVNVRIFTKFNIACFFDAF